MKDKALDIGDFLEASAAAAEESAVAEESKEVISEDIEESAEEIDIQKAVVEELAAEKVELHERMTEKDEKIAILEKEISALQDENAALKKEACELKEVSQKFSDLSNELEEAKKKVAELEDREFEAQERNPNALALLDRDVDLPDRFPGETRDHVIEVIKEARDKAEAEGRVRRAQLLESVLVANEPSGNLAQKRENLEKFFNANGNIVNGTVIEELTRCGIAYRNGEEYLLPKEIILRTY